MENNLKNGNKAKYSAEDYRRIMGNKTSNADGNAVLLKTDECVNETEWDGIFDSIIANEAYDEYVAEGKKRRPIEDLWNELDLKE